MAEYPTIMTAESVNAKRGYSWTDNPWALVYRFSVSKASAGKRVGGDDGG